jgi:hypothetical protein
MKKTLIIVLVMVLASPAFSQVKFGIKAGASTTTVPTYEVTGSGPSISSLDDASWGFHAGIFLRLGMGGIYLQPEVVFATNTYNYNVHTTAPAEIKQTFNRLEIPVLLGVKLGPLRINAGPAANMPIGKPDALINDNNWDNMYRGTTFGYQAGLGVDILKTLTLDARYGGSFAKKYGDSANVGGATFRLDDRQPSLILSLGIMF